MANEYCCFLERDTMHFGRQITTFPMKVLLNIGLAKVQGVQYYKKMVRVKVKLHH